MIPMMTLFSRSVTAAVFAFALLVSGNASAQGTMSGVPNAMQGFSQNRDQPIQIEAASLEMRDKKKEATFSGNVKVVQGDTTMTSKSLVVFYEDKSSQPAAAPKAAAKPAKGAPMQSAQASTSLPQPKGALRQPWAQAHARHASSSVWMLQATTQCSAAHATSDSTQALQPTTAAALWRQGAMLHWPVLQGFA